MSAELSMSAKRQLEARQDRAEVVADAVEHRGALLGRPLDAALHLDEGVAGLSDLARAMRAEIEIAALAEILRRAREPQDRPDLVAQEDDRDREQNDHRRRASRERRCGRSPRRRACGASPACSTRSPRSTRISIRPDRPTVSSQNGSRSWVLISLGSVRVSGSSAAKNDLRHRRRQRTGGQHVASMRNRSDARLRQKGVVLAGRQPLIEVRQRADVARHRRGEAVRDQLPVMLHEGEGDRGLQQHHRQDDDQQRALVEAFRKHVRKAARAAPPQLAHPRQLTKSSEGRPRDHPSAIRR